MGKLSDDDTKVILQKLAVFVPSFYALFYIVGVIFIGGFKLPWKHLGWLPFYFQWDDFRPGYRRAELTDRELPLASWLCFCTTYLLTALLIHRIVRNTRKAWDYAVTISIWHWVTSCIVMTDFPKNWVWWVTNAVATFILSTLSEAATYYLHDMREIAVEH